MEAALLSRPVASSGSTSLLVLSLPGRETWIWVNYDWHPRTEPQLLATCTVCKSPRRSHRYYPEDIHVIRVYETAGNLGLDNPDYPQLPDEATECLLADDELAAIRAAIVTTETLLPYAGGCTNPDCTTQPMRSSLS